jgi:hypothetical protein
MCGAIRVQAVRAWLADRFRRLVATRDHVVLDRRSTLGGSGQDRWDEFGW